MISHEIGAGGNSGPVTLVKPIYGEKPLSAILSLGFTNVTEYNSRYVVLSGEKHSANALRALELYSTVMEDQVANRALLAKAARAVEQRRELGNAEYFKPAYVSAFRISRNELARLCDGVMVTKVEPGVARGLQRGRRAGVCGRRLWLL